MGKYKKFCNIRVRKFHFLKYKEFSFGSFYFYFSSLDLKMVQVGPYYTTVMQLISQILHAFSKNEYTPGIFIDLSKVFNTVDHDILYVWYHRNKQKIVSQPFKK